MSDKADRISAPEFFVQVNALRQDSDRRPIGYVIQENGCWEWRGGHSGTKGTSNEYGQWTVNGVKHTAHRAMYEHLVGPVPDGLVVDHLCRNRLCVNPDHLEPVTQRENVMRGKGVAASNARKTHCPLGHEYTPDNTYTRLRSRHCLTCARELARRIRARRAS